MSKRTTLLLVIALALVATGLMLYLPTRDVAVPSSVSPVVDEQNPPPTVDAPLLGSIPAAVAPAESATRAPALPPAATAEDDSELRDAIWIDGRVVVPDGTPPDEHVQVIARGKPFEKRPPYRTTPAADGSFRVAFKDGTTAGILMLDARFLYLDSDVVLDPSKRGSLVVLEPKLGGLICGRVVVHSLGAKKAAFFPDGSSRGGSVGGGSLRDRSVRDGWVRATSSAAGFLDGGVERTASITDDLRFEFHGVPADESYRVRVELPGLAGQVREGVRITPGRAISLDLDVLSGATVRGRVLDDGGAALSGIKVIASSFEGHDSATTAPDGTFSFEGLYPGKTTLRADSTGTRGARVELGDLADGEVRVGVDVVLVRELPVSGRVRWPDGSPAKNCAVEYTRHLEFGETKAFGDWKVQTDSDGEFRIVDPGDGPLELTAIPKPEDGRGAANLKWVAHVGGVQPGTEGITLLLGNGSTVRGTVVSDAGMAMGCASVVAYRVAGGWSGLGRRGPDSAVVDGRFEITGLYDGEWNVIAEAPGYAKSVAAHISLPRDVGPIDLALRRTATLSGTVVDESNGPVAHARLKVGVGEQRGPDEGLGYALKEMSGSRTDTQGRFEIQGVEPGRLVVSALSEDDNLHGTISVTVEPGDSRADLTIQLRPRASRKR